MHLVEENLIFRPEKCFSGRCEIYLSMRKLPFLSWRWFDFGSQSAAENLVAETDAAEAHFRILLPRRTNPLYQLPYPFIITMGIILAPSNQYSVDFPNISYIRNLASFRLDNELHHRLEFQRWFMILAGFREE